MPSENREEKKRERTFPVSSSEVEPTAGNLEAERSGKGVWYPEEHDRDIWDRFRASIARQAFSPGETIMCPLWPGKQSNWRGLSWQNCFRQSNIDTLVTKELHHLPPMEATLPVSKDTPDEELVVMKVPPVQEKRHLRPMQVKKQANRPRLFRRALRVVADS